MPNWVFNSLNVEGSSEDISAIKNQLNKPFEQPIQSNGDLAFTVQMLKYSNPVFAFWNITAPTDLEAYHHQPVKSDKDVSDPDWWADVQRKSAVDNSWYNWNNRNWGVKWDVAVSDDQKYPSTELLQESETNLLYRFDTPWGIPEAAMTTLSQQYPNVVFNLEYEEETGWGGAIDFVDGQQTVTSEYNWKCRECDYEEVGEPPYCEECEYDMCPSCGWGEPDKACQTHMVKSDSNPTEENV
jgi:hypothetical protein